MKSHARTDARARNLRALHFLLWLCIMILTAFPVVSEAQYKGDDIPGFLGLQSGTQAPPGFYVGNVVWVYPTSTIKDNSGRPVSLPGSSTSTAEIILLSVVTNYKLFGAHVGGSAGFPFIKNRIELNSLDVNTPLAYTDMFLGASLGWSLKRADIMAGYNLYIPTGRFSQGGTNNTGLGMWGNEFTIGSTVYLDQKKLWNVARLLRRCAGGLHPWEITIAEMLSDVGCRTAIFGKWHLGARKGRLPMDQGFDEWFGFETTDIIYWTGKPGMPLLYVPSL